MTTADKAYLCPKCGSSSISTPLLIGGDYVCEACGWNGQDPILVPFGNPFGSSSEAFNQFTMEILKAYSEVAALPIGKILVNWGFVSRDEKTGKPSVPELSRFVKAMAVGIIRSVIEERQKIELERVQLHVRPNAQG